MFIQVESTPNENALKQVNTVSLILIISFNIIRFKPGVPVLVPSRDSGQMAVEFTQFSDTIRSPLARSLFSIQGVKGMYSNNTDSVSYY